MSGRRRRTEGTGLRPPLKPDVRFPRIQLSQRLAFSLNVGMVSMKPGSQDSSRRIALESEESSNPDNPAFVPMRPNPSHDPGIETVEELTDVGLTVYRPQPTRLPLSQSRSFRSASGNIRPSDYSHFVSHFAFRLIGSLIAVPPANHMSPPGVTRYPSIPCRYPQTPWCDG